MPFRRARLAVAAAFAAGSASAFAPGATLALPALPPAARLSASMLDLVCDEDECALPPSGVMMNDVMVTADTLRSMDLADSMGARRVSGEFLGDDKSVVVFLRHLG